VLLLTNPRIKTSTIKPTCNTHNREKRKEDPNPKTNQTQHNSHQNITPNGQTGANTHNFHVQHNTHGAEQHTHQPHARDDDSNPAAAITEPPKPTDTHTAHKQHIHPATRTTSFRNQQRQPQYKNEVNFIFLYRYVFCRSRVVGLGFGNLGFENGKRVRKQ